MRFCDCTIDQSFTLNAFGVNRQWLESTNTKYSCIYCEQKIHGFGHMHTAPYGSVVNIWGVP